MEWMIMDEEDFMRRKYSNETMRKLKKKIDKYKTKKKDEGYNETLDREKVYLNNKRLRTQEEILDDRVFNNGSM